MMRVLFIGIVALFGAAPVCEAKVKSMNIAYKDGDVELEGYLAYDDAVSGPRPGVLVIHEWWGLNDYTRKRADMLAEMGYIAFAADMYGKGVTAKDPKTAGKLAGGVRGDAEKWLRRINVAMDQLRGSKLADTKRLAAIGYCFGGSSVLHLALNGGDVAAVVSFHGALPAGITVEQAKAAKAKILVCHGALDTFIKDDVITKFRAVLDEAKTDYQFVYYSGAVHSFTNPDADKAGVAGIAYQRPADVRSWTHMKQLFDEAFAK